MLYIILVLLLMNAFSTIEESERPATALKSQRKKTFAAAVFTNSHNHTPSDKKSCQWLNRLKHQSKICWRRRGLPEVLLNARNLSVFHCENQFEYVQWNCSRREFFFKKFYRETAVMYSIASSALMYSVARACSEGMLSGCKCGDHGKTKNSSEFQWGGCSDNIKYAKKFTKKFLQLRKKGDDLNSIIRFNTEVGIKMVMENEDIICRCHGVSGSCSIKICWKKIRSFDIISKQLRSLYYDAVQLQPKNSIRSFKGAKNSRKLVYLENSPNFCSNTVGRRCSNKENCATLCCSNNFTETRIEVVNDTCECQWRKEKFDVKCESCKENKTIYWCK